MGFICKYVAIHVPDLRAAEVFYREVLGMELLFRESEQRGGAWHTLRPGLNWDDVATHRIQVDMVALCRGAFVLALFRGTPVPGTMLELCIGAPPGEAERVRERLGEESTVLEAEPELLRFRDPFGFRWAIQPLEASFRSSGEIAGRWIH